MKVVKETRFGESSDGNTTTPKTRLTGAIEEGDASIERKIDIPM